MKIFKFFVFIPNILSVFGQHPIPSAKFSVEEVKVAEFIAKAEADLWKDTQIATEIEWAYESNITDHNEKMRLEKEV